MTTTPTTPSIIPAWIVSWEAFIKAHERLILTGAASLVLWHFGNKIENIFVQKHLAEQSVLNQQITQQEAQNKNLQTQLAQMQLTFDETVKSLNAKIDAKKQAVIIQQQADAKMPPVELSARWAELIAAPVGSITPDSGGSIKVSVDASHTTVNELEKVPLLTEQTIDLQTELKSCTDLSAKKDETITGVKTELETEKKARVEDAKVAKDNQRKSFWRGFKLGAITGFIGGVVTLHKI